MYPVSFLLIPVYIKLSSFSQLAINVAPGNKWDGLLNEVIDLIVQALENDVSTIGKKIQWLMVNKQWYDWYQPIKYKDVEISLKLSDRLLENILHSKFQPGRFVKSIEFKEPQSARYTSDHPPLDTVPLHLLMACCPNVKNVKLP